MTEEIKSGQMPKWTAYRYLKEFMESDEDFQVALNRYTLYEQIVKENILEIRRPKNKEPSEALDEIEKGLENMKLSVSSMNRKCYLAGVRKVEEILRELGAL